MCRQLLCFLCCSLVLFWFPTAFCGRAPVPWSWTYGPLLSRHTNLTFTNPLPLSFWSPFPPIQPSCFPFSCPFPWAVFRGPDCPSYSRGYTASLSNMSPRLDLCFCCQQVPLNLHLRTPHAHAFRAKTAPACISPAIFHFSHPSAFSTRRTLTGYWIGTHRPLFFLFSPAELPNAGPRKLTNELASLPPPFIPFPPSPSLPLRGFPIPGLAWLAGCDGRLHVSWHDKSLFSLFGISRPEG